MSGDEVSGDRDCLKADPRRREVVLHRDRYALQGYDAYNHDGVARVYLGSDKLTEAGLPPADWVGDGAGPFP
jgi:hypothetical protein